MAQTATIGTAVELRRSGKLVGKLGELPVLVVQDGDRTYAIEDRCPHLGFPLHRGTVECGMVTCHWHHARFDLATGCTLDPWADDATGFDVRIEGDDVIVAARPAGDRAAPVCRSPTTSLPEIISSRISKPISGLPAMPNSIPRIATSTRMFGMSRCLASPG